MRTNCFPDKSKRAFTLIELVAVIAALVLLSSLVLPALAHTKTKSPTAGCLSNYRQLMIGWSMYKEENNDLLMPNAPAGVGGSAWIIPSGTEGWSAASGNTNSVYLTGGLMAPYVANDVRVFKCPADVVPSANGQRLRSCSMNCQIGTVSGLQNYDYPALQYAKGSDLTCPTPANLFVLADEHPGSINDGYLAINSFTPNFIDVPASYHGNGCGFGFSDGHAEEHHWRTTALAISVTPGVNIGPIPVNGANADWAWFTQHAVCNHR